MLNLYYENETFEVKLKNLIIWEIMTRGQNFSENDKININNIDKFLWGGCSHLFKLYINELVDTSYNIKNLINEVCIELENIPYNELLKNKKQILINTDEEIIKYRLNNSIHTIIWDDIFKYLNEKKFNENLIKYKKISI